jgi:hypothetical protein
MLAFCLNSGILVGPHKYIVGKHPKTASLNDGGMKPELRQFVPYRVSPQNVFELADFEIESGC